MEDLLVGVVVAVVLFAEPLVGLLAVSFELLAGPLAVPSVGRLLPKEEIVIRSLRSRHRPYLAVINFLFMGLSSVVTAVVNVGLKIASQKLTKREGQDTMTGAVQAISEQ